MNKDYLKNINKDDFLDRMPKKGVFDLTCSFHIGDERINKVKTPILQDFRVICAWNPLAKKWHLYITNLSKEIFSADDIHELYRFRWVIELIFKELKGDYDLGKMLLGNEPMAFIHIYSMLLRFIISRDLFTWIVSSTRKNDKRKYTPMLWSKVFSEKGLEFLSILNQNLFGTGNVKKRWDKLERSLRHLGKSRNNNETLTLKFSEIQ